MARASLRVAELSERQEFSSTSEMRSSWSTVGALAKTQSSARSRQRWIFGAKLVHSQSRDYIIGSMLKASSALRKVELDGCWFGRLCIGLILLLLSWHCRRPLFPVP
jgi:hypothetical protein